MSDLLSSRSTVGTPLLLLTLDRFGFEALQWESEVVNQELEALSDGRVPETNKDKVNALILALTTDRFHMDEQAFSSVCNALGGENRPVVFTSFDPPHVDEMAWTVWETALYDPPTEDDPLEDRFSDRVKTFIRTILEERGFMFAPQPLDFIELRSNPDIDEDLVQEVWNVQQRDADLVTGFVKNRMREMLDQVSQLDLREGSVSTLVENFSQHLGEQ